MSKIAHCAYLSIGKSSLDNLKYIASQLFSHFKSKRRAIVIHMLLVTQRQFAVTDLQAS